MIHFYKFSRPFFSTNTSVKTGSIIEGIATTPILPHIPKQDEIAELARFVGNSKGLTVLTGAGISTPSGIPDYRGPSGSYKLGHKPMTHSEFMTKETSRKRFWARSMVGWQNVASAVPNNAHISLAKLEGISKVNSIITQNVDRLHHRAGSNHIIELHGRVDQVRCQSCKAVVQRTDWQKRLISANEHFLEELNEMQKQMRSRMASRAINSNIRADGDAELGLDDYSAMCVPGCKHCGGIIKLDVVMFGDNVSPPVVAAAAEQVASADALLVIGTSLEVFSAYRFVRAASEQGKSIAIVNFGETRAERQGIPGIRYKSDADCALLLDAVSKSFLD